MKITFIIICIYALYLCICAILTIVIMQPWNYNITRTKSNAIIHIYSHLTLACSMNYILTGPIYVPAKLNKSS